MIETSPELPGLRSEPRHLGLLLLPGAGMLNLATLGACSDLTGCDLHPSSCQTRLARQAQGDESPSTQGLSVNWALVSLL